MAIQNDVELIKKLSDQTIKFIAAGEVITRPFNVVKELVENSIDAGAQNIKVTVEQGGLKLIEVIDNGHGIAKENAKLLCQRYATSKLTSSNDLRRISTFGFRGEALSSISEVAEVEVKTFNMKANKVGWHGTYRHGVLQNPVTEKYVQSPGTRIRVNDLFSNSLGRKNLSSFLDEKKVIVDLIMKLAIHHRDKITFILNDAANNDLVCSLAPVELGPCLGNFYGVDLESNLIETQIQTNSDNDISTNRFDSSTHIAFTYKKSTGSIHQSNMILFVNDRLVECDDLKREVSALILEYFGNKQYISLVYISLKVPPTDIDVNTHPAKATVTLHYQKEIIGLILNEMRIKFNDNLSSQVVSAKTYQQKTIGELIKHSSSQESIHSVSSQKRFKSQTNSSSSQASEWNGTSPAIKRPFEQVHNDGQQPIISQMRLPPSRQRRELLLRSLVELREQIAKEKTLHSESIKIIKNSVFVGIFDHHRALIQHETKLYAINLRSFLKEQFYQFYLFDFGNFTPIDILPPGNKISFMIETHLNDLKRHEPNEFAKLLLNTPETVIDKLISHADMFQDYLSIKLTRVEILTIPNIIPEHVPNLAFLGQFFVMLANKVDYSDERDCFHQMGRLIADFYSNPPLNLKDMRVHKRYHDFVEVRLYDAIKKYLILPDWLLTDGNIFQITDTKDLYKVFERC